MQVGRRAEYLDVALRHRLQGDLLICSSLKSNVACQDHRESAMDPKWCLLQGNSEVVIKGEGGEEIL